MIASLRQEPIPAAARTPPAILVVEDEVLVRMMIAQELRIAGFAVIEAASPDEAMEVLANRDDIAVVFTDLRMRGPNDGIDFARRLRAQSRAVKIIFSSGHLSAVDSIAHDGFFPKPCNVPRLIEHIRTMLAWERVGPPDR